MPEKEIPLVGSPDLRNQDAYSTIGRGQRFIGCVFDVVKNPVTGNGKVYCSKRPGVATLSTPAAGSAGVAISDDGTKTVFNATTGTVYSGTTNCGAIGANVYPSISKGVIGSENVWFFTTNTTAWFLAQGAIDAADATFTANRTAASTTLSSISAGEFSGLYVGQLLSGTGIDAAARIASLNPGAGTLEMTVAASSGAGTSTTVTFERVAKIIDADFPADIDGNMIEIDGYVFVGSDDKIYNSDQNSVTSWAAASYLTLASNSGLSAGVGKYKGRLVGFGSGGYEFFYNAGNATGSPFTRTGDSGGVGCAGAVSSNTKFIASGGDYLAWLDERGGVYLMDGGSAKEITTQSVKRAISEAGASSSDITVSSAFGKHYVCVSRPGSFSFMYDLELGIWHESGFTDRLLLAGVRDSDNTTAEDCLVINDVATGGKVYTFDLSSPVYQDDGQAYTMTIQSGRLDLGHGKSVTIHEARLDSDIQASGTATFATSSDDAQNFSTIGTFNMTALNPKIIPCGYYRDGILNFKITHNANTAFRASTLYLRYSIGST